MRLVQRFVYLLDKVGNDNNNNNNIIFNWKDIIFMIMTLEIRTN